jgi:hypothetical protein
LIAANVAKLPDNGGRPTEAASKLRLTAHLAGMIDKTAPE